MQRGHSESTDEQLPKEKKEKKKEECIIFFQSIYKDEYNM